MSNINNCRFCQYYAPEGRRGGFCNKLQVAVAANWEACPLAQHPFAKGWDEAVPILEVHNAIVNNYHSAPAFTGYHTGSL